MKRTFSVIIALVLILGLRLVAYGGNALKEATPFPAPTEDPAFGDKISAEVTPSPTSVRDSIAGERISEEVMRSPTPAEKKIVWEVSPSPTPVGDLVAGEKIFVSACKICHRNDMIHNDFVASKTNQELVEFIKTGGIPNRPPVMLPKGGKPSLTDEKLYDIVAYLRSLQN